MKCCLFQQLQCIFFCDLSYNMGCTRWAVREGVACSYWSNSIICVHLMVCVTLVICFVTGSWQCVCDAGRLWVQESHRWLDHLHHRGEPWGEGSRSCSPLWVHRRLRTHGPCYPYPAPAGARGPPHPPTLQVHPLHLQPCHPWERLGARRSVQEPYQTPSSVRVAHHELSLLMFRHDVACD